VEITYEKKGEEGWVPSPWGTFPEKKKTEEGKKNTGKRPQKTKKPISSSGGTLHGVGEEGITRKAKECIGERAIYQYFYRSGNKSASRKNSKKKRGNERKGRWVRERKKERSGEGRNWGCG